MSGRVLDTDGVPLAGVNIIVEDTYLGSATDLNGDYFILNIPPGIYSVSFEMIGYRKLVQQELQIVSDFTTNLDVVLEQETLELEGEVLVVAERPLIRKDATSTMRVVDAAALVEMPVKDFKDVLVTQAGFTTDAAGGIHVRGGRTKEILYMIDGVVVKDPLLGDFSGSVNQNAIQEMTVISGTFNAEYGQAMSSVVNIVTKEGGEDFHGKLEYISGEVNASPYHEAGAFSYLDENYANVDSNYLRMDLADSLFAYLDRAPSGFYPQGVIPLFRIPMNGSVSLNLGGKLPFLDLNYFASAFYSNEESPLPHGADINQDMQLKLTRRLSSKLKLSGHLHSSARLYQNYSHAWKYRPDFDEHTFKRNDRLAFTVTHSPLAALFYNVHLSRQIVGTKEGVKSLNPSEYERPLTDESVYFYSTGNGDTYSDNTSTTSSMSFDLTWQANQRHQLKTGFTLDLHDLNIHNEEEPWEAGTNFLDDTTYAPSEATFYVQDKIELDYLIINLGMRYDQVDPAVAMWENVNRFVEYDSTTGVWVQAPVVTAPTQTKLSPRIGLAFPITVNTVFHVSYGHFFQVPNFESMTYNSRKDISAALPLVGNARVKPQKTVAYEFGLKQALSQSTRLEVTVWSKDIRDLLSTLQVRYLSNQVIVFENTDYASVKGLDLSFDRQFTGMFAANLSYTLSVAKGNNSSPRAGYFSAYENEEVPHQEFYLDFDQRHDLSVNFSLRTAADDGPVIGGVRPLANINTNLLLNAGSGLPYTPFVDPTVRVDVNSARKPWTYTLDLRLKKSIMINDLRPTVFLEATNITDHENVLFVNSRTGKPFDSGTTGLVGQSDDSNLNPAKLGPGRAIKFGLSLSW